MIAMVGHIARHEATAMRRNLWLVVAVGLMALFAVVLTTSGTGGGLGVDRLTVAVASLTTLSVYLVPLIALLISFDAVAGERERGTLALTLAYPVPRASFLLGKFVAHMATLAVALVVGLGLAGGLSYALGSVSEASLLSLARLYATALLLGATFVALGYVISTIVRQPAAAAGLAIAAWLVGIVLYDIALLGALVADDGGTFTSAMFPWLMVANPADAFRLVNLAGIDNVVLGAGVGSLKGMLPGIVPLLALAAWPAAALLLAWSLFRRIEP